MKFDLKLILIVVILSLANGTTVSKLSRTGKNTYCLMNGQLSFDGQFCWYIENTTMDFRNAEKSCINNYGGHLASIHSVFDNMMITDMARGIAALYGNMFLIGLNRISDDGLWYYTDKSIVNYNNWAQGEPVNGQQKECVNVDITYGYWYAANCYDEHAYVCQTPSLNDQQTTTTISPSIWPNTTSGSHFCLQNGQLSPNEEVCWYVQNITMDFVHAEKFCLEIFGGHLASVHSVSDNMKLTQVSQEIASLHGGVFYTGGNRLQSNWSYTDGSLFNFTSWAQNDTPNKESRNCVALGISYGFWYAEYCYAEHTFVCQTVLHNGRTTCPQNGILSSNGKWCWYVPNITMNFASAETFCTQLYDGHLASVHSVFDNMKLDSEPGSGPLKNCITVHVANSLWYAADCFNESPFVCQASSLKNQSTTTTGCPQNAQLSPNKEFCWYVQNFTKDFVNAEIACNDLPGGHLASVHSVLDNMMITDTAREIAALYGNLFFIGGNRLTSDDLWSYIDGSTFNFHDWAQGEPANEQSRNCITIDIAYGYWYAANCFDEHAYVCQTSVVTK